MMISKANKAALVIMANVPTKNGLLTYPAFICVLSCVFGCLANGRSIFTLLLAFV